MNHCKDPHKNNQDSLESLRVSSWFFGMFRSCFAFHMSRTQGVKENINPLAGKTFSVSRCKSGSPGFPTWQS